MTEMNIEELHKKWDMVKSQDILNGYKSIILSKESIPNLFVGVDKHGIRCLIFSIKNAKRIDIKEIYRDKINISYYEDLNILIIPVEDKDYYEVFDHFILSVFNTIKNIKKTEEQLKLFYKIFNKWVNFFEPPYDDRLPQDSVRGLFGELYVLNNLLNNCTSDAIDYCLESWVGPYNKSHDFLLEEKDLEVKTKDASAVKVKLASEFQLDIELGKMLNLIVVSISTDIHNGSTLEDLFKMIKDAIYQNAGDVSIFLKALQQLNVTINNISEYNNYRFSIQNIKIYDATSSDFPKIVPSNIPESINTVRYYLNLTDLDDYLVEPDKYIWI